MNKTKKKTKPIIENTPCEHCNYKFRHLHAGQCPMCKHCTDCGEKIHSCKCIEGE